jgi:hypothetical protein
MNPSNRNSTIVLRIVFWTAIGIVLMVFGACAALSRPTEPRPPEIAPDRPVHPLFTPVGPEPPEAELVA